MMLTATAPPISVLSICASLGVNDPLVLRGDLSRRQMQYTTVTASGVRQRDAVLLQWLLQRLYAGERGIVYVGTQRRAELLAERLRVGLCALDSHSLLSRAGELTEHYHAGLDEGRRDEVELRWRDNEHSVLVATIAWGMGMDDADVRFAVIEPHGALPGGVARRSRRSTGAPLVPLLVQRVGQRLGACLW